MVSLPTAGLVVIREKKLLLAFSCNKQAFYLPGGKLDPGEGPREALLREISEELDIRLDPEALQFYTHISAPAYGEDQGIIMEQDCFIYPLTETPRPAAEIGSLQYFDSAGYAREPAQVPGVVMLIDRLKKEGLIT